MSKLRIARDRPGTERVAGRRSLAWRHRTLTVMVVLAGVHGQRAAADRIVLRNLDVITDKTVRSVNEDGARLDDGTILPWDRIERGRVSRELQADFDQLLKDLGGHLYRVRQRLSTGDYAGLAPHAEAVYPRYVGRSSSTAYMVMQALMWARLATSRREAALEPYLRCYEYLRSTGQGSNQVALPGKRRLSVDMKTGMTPELDPVWFDAAQAGKALGSVAKAIGAMQKPRPPGARVYYATLALAAGHPKTAQQVLADLKGLESLKTIVQARIELGDGKPAEAIGRLDTRWRQLDRAERPLALYWLGRARLESPDQHTRQLGILDLLRIAAVYGTQRPELAAAGLHEAMRALAADGDIQGSISLRRELLDRYGQTWYAARVRKATR